jgi:hypothetical protein
MGNSSHVTVRGVRTVDLKSTLGNIVRLKNVHDVPFINKIPITGSLLCQDGYKIVFESNKFYADSKRTERSYEVGDKVLLKLQPYAQATVINRPFPKLAYKFFGPYTILERIGNAAYRLELPVGCQVHNVFHVSQLKDYRSDYSPVFADLPNIPALDTLDTEP